MPRRLPYSIDDDIPVVLPPFGGKRFPYNIVPPVQKLCLHPGCVKMGARRHRGFDKYCFRHLREHRDRKRAEKASANDNTVKSTRRTLSLNQKHKGMHCAQCGPEVVYHRCQLDVHHLNYNERDYTPTNLQTLCSNCHRLVTYNDKEAKRLKELVPC